jgi:hypothetical protein
VKKIKEDKSVLSNVRIEIDSFYCLFFNNGDLFHEAIIVQIYIKP